MGIFGAMLIQSVVGTVLPFERPGYERKNKVRIGLSSSVMALSARPRRRI